MSDWVIEERAPDHVRFLTRVVRDAESLRRCLGVCGDLSAVLEDDGSPDGVSETLALCEHDRFLSRRGRLVVLDYLSGLETPDGPCLPYRLTERLTLHLPLSQFGAEEGALHKRAIHHKLTLLAERDGLLPGAGADWRRREVDLELHVVQAVLDTFQGRLGARPREEVPA